MLELLLCSLVTLLPDYLYRRRIQGKTWGKDLNIFSIWYELRWGLTGCLILTIALLTMVFYFHPSTNRVTSAFRTVTVLPEAGGRIAEVYVANGQHVEAGQKLFRLDDSAQRSAVEAARRAVNEMDAALVVTQSDYEAATGVVNQAQSALEQATDDLARSRELSQRSPNAVSARELERLENLVSSREGALKAASASRDAVQAKIETLIPAQKKSAEAALAQAQVNLDKTVIQAGTAGKLQQFELRPGDFVSPVMRPAGILVPDDSGVGAFVAGFDQMAAQVVKPGMVGEMVCLSKPFTVIPMVVVQVQDVIAAGQFRPSDQLRDFTGTARPGTVTAFMEPLYKGSADDVPPGSRCVVNGYTSFHDRLDDPGTGVLAWLFYHTVDATAFIRAKELRIRALLMPVTTLVFSGH